MIFAFNDAFAELAYLRLAWLFLADSPILSCADNISNQNSFGKVHLLLFNVQWYLDWDLRVLSQDWTLKSAQIGKNDVQFPANFYVSDSLSEHVCSNAGVSSITMLLVCCFILKAGLRKNWITLHFSHVFISNFSAKSKHYFCLDWVSQAMFSARFTANCWG